MTLKHNARDWTIKEQIIEDLVTGLTLQFEVIPESTARYRLRIFGDIPHGNREIIFDVEGKEAGSGTLVSGLCKPAWLTDVDDLTDIHDRDWIIKEQIIKDLVTDLTFQFEVVPDDEECPFRMRIFGDLPLGNNRELLFGVAGKQIASGTFLGGCSKPAWLTDVDKLTETEE